MKKLLLALFLFVLCKAHAQNTLVLYPIPASGMTVQDPSVVPQLTECGAPKPYKVGENTDFTVSVKAGTATCTDSGYQPLFSYNTFVNSSSGDFSQSTRSSFVTFDYTGTVTLKIKCKFAWLNSEADVTIRPQSRLLAKSICPTTNEILLTLSTAALSADASDKLSVEIMGNRYSNLQIFANRIITAPTITGPTIYEYTAAGNGTNTNLYNTSYNSQNKKIIIKTGAIVTVPFDSSLSENDQLNGRIKLNAGDEIYFENGGILNGGVMIDGELSGGGNGAKIRGRGIIDLTNFPKRYRNEDKNKYAAVQPITIRNAKDITLEGVIINDSQQLSVELTNSGGTTSDANPNININNLKIFTRVLWGDGFHMKGTSNVEIKDCFIRTSDDCISIYASRRETWDQCVSGQPYANAPSPPAYVDSGCSGCTYPAYMPCDSASSFPYKNRDALNIKATHTLLYADNAHAIEIGWHGNQLLNNGLNIYNLLFEKIDILEHDSKWVQQNGERNATYEGAIGINCSDDNKCGNFLFKQINVEGFTAGKILTVHVMKYGEGDAIRSGKSVYDVRFEDLTYTGTGEYKSTIKGVSCDRFVNGVHFDNFKVRSNPSAAWTNVTSANMATYFETNTHAYNITFQESINYDNTSLTHNGVYTVKNKATSQFLKYTSSGSVVSSTSGGASDADKAWKLSLVNYAHYRFRPNSSLSLTMENTLEQPSGACQSRLVKTVNDDSVKTNQEWKVVPVPGEAGYYTINNAYTRAYLTDSGTSVTADPKSSTDSQKWRISAPGIAKNAAANHPDVKPLTKPEVYPNPTTDYLHIDNLEADDARFTLIAINGSKVIEQPLGQKNSEIYVGDLPDGIYIVKIENTAGILYSEKFVKSH